MPIAPRHRSGFTWTTIDSLQTMPEPTLMVPRSIHNRVGDATFYSLLARPATTYRIGGDLPWSRIFTDRRRYGTSSPPRWFRPQLR
ncbi:hypothetical protein, partial [Rubripirellula obstinata]|uniref:hypothetical protein n=1 Tax=Rubripirellula obstinata TaxID=406547 RepID=UPI001EE3D448